MDPLIEAYRYQGSLDDAGVKGVLLLSGMPLEETILGCLTQFPHRYQWIEEGETLGDEPLNGHPWPDSDLQTLSSDLQNLPSLASLVIGHVAETYTAEPTAFDRRLAIARGWPEPAPVRVTRIDTDLGPVFELETRTSIPGSIHTLPVGKLIIASVLYMARTREAIPTDMSSHSMKSASHSSCRITASGLLGTSPGAA